jgi:hypothetical protein
MIEFSISNRLVNNLMTEFIADYDKITLEEFDEAFTEFKKMFQLVGNQIKEQSKQSAE